MSKHFWCKIYESIAFGLGTVPSPLPPPQLLVPSWGWGAEIETRCRWELSAPPSPSGQRGLGINGHRVSIQHKGTLAAQGSWALCAGQYLAWSLPPNPWVWGNCLQRDLQPCWP